MNANHVRHFCHLSVVIATFAVAKPCHGDTPAFEFGGYSLGAHSSFTGTRGWQFFFGGQNSILITQLGVFDQNGNGLVNAHEIGLWRDIGSASGTLLASATV